MSADIDFPLIYCNGDSYSNDKYHPTLHNNSYANVVAESCAGFVINKSINGSCNRRIVRTTLHDMIVQRKLNPYQQIIALIGLSFEMRSEIWQECQTIHGDFVESNFITHSFTSTENWKEQLLNGVTIVPEIHSKQYGGFLAHYSKGRAYFYSPYAERINLLTDLIMLKSTLDAHNIDFLIFQSPKAEKLESDYLLDFLKQETSNESRFFDFENFGFCDWAFEQGFTPLDYLDRPRIGHYGADAHRAFATDILIPKLQELKIL